MASRGRPRSPNPTPGALRSRRHYERLRGRDPLACALVDINGAVLTMLVQKGKLPDRVSYTRGEVSEALSAYVREDAEKQF